MAYVLACQVGGIYSGQLYLYSSFLIYKSTLSRVLDSQLSPLLGTDLPASHSCMVFSRLCSYTLLSPAS